MGEGKWIINRVNIPERDRRAGWGSKLLTKVVQEISGEAKTILVFPGGYNTPKEVLKAFYEKNGFVSNEDESIFTFTPKS
jgi:predicted GNAT family N-acyltransferase